MENSLEFGDRERKRLADRIELNFWHISNQTTVAQYSTEGLQLSVLMNHLSFFLMNL